MEVISQLGTLHGIIDVNSERLAKQAEVAASSN